MLLLWRCLCLRCFQNLFCGRVQEQIPLYALLHSEQRAWVAVVAASTAVEQPAGPGRRSEHFQVLARPGDPRLSDPQSSP